MEILSFNLANKTQAQIREAIRILAKSGLTGGIYLWINSLNGKFYVGSTLNFYTRIMSYFYLTNINSILLKAFEKYGLNGFTLALIAIPNASKDLVLELEQHVLDTFLPQYNIQPKACSSAGRILSEEHKAKIAASRKSITFSEETIARMSTSHMGERNGRYNKGTPVYLYELLPSELELCASFPNRARASTMLGIPASTLFNYIKNQIPFKINGIKCILSYDGNLTK
uniref:Putative intron-encoded endonuclease bI1 n=1 Tax=Anthurium amnicola TaxID=1678845 RepID=A0A1D1Y4G3_9ARAE